MKKLLYTAVLAISIFGCKNDKKVENSASIENISESTMESEKSIKTELQKLTPLTSEQLKSAFPKNIKELQLDKEPVVNGQTISGHFGSRKITLGITDSAGDNYLRASYFLDALNDENFVDTADTKHIKKERNGFQTFAKSYVGSHTELEFLYNNRFHIHLISKMNPDELWEAFDIEALQLLKKFD